MPNYTDSYMIISRDNQSDLESSVDETLKEGGICVGGISHVVYQVDDELIERWSQAVVTRYIEEEE